MKWFQQAKQTGLLSIRTNAAIGTNFILCFFALVILFTNKSEAVSLTDSTKTVKCAAGYTATETSIGSKQFYCVKASDPTCSTGFSISSKVGVDACIKSEDAKCSESNSIFSYVVIADGGSVTNSQGTKTNNVDCGGTNKYCCAKTDGTSVNTTYKCSSSECAVATKVDGKPYCSCSKPVSCAVGSTISQDLSGTSDKCVSYKSPTF